ncbi:MAG: hypothetical protein JO110_22515, partial [Acetobacteraceae bacterium]|nr:hypothetical protein [Acetobacteraceae bacterium]
MQLSHSADQLEEFRIARTLLAAEDNRILEVTNGLNPEPKQDVYRQATLSQGQQVGGRRW